MIDVDKIVSDALAAARAEVADRVQMRAALTATLQKQRAELDSQLVALAAFDASDASDLAAIDAKAAKP